MPEPLVDVDELRAALAPLVSLGEVIGMGGQRAVFEAEVDREPRVLKLMPSFAAERAEREVRIGCRFDHPGLATILDETLRLVSVGGADFVYFTEQRIDGTSLDQLPRLGLCDVLQLVDELLRRIGASL